MPKKKWSDVPTPQRWALCMAAALELAMTVAALRDLAARPADRVRGPKMAWAVAVFIQPVGPVVYFAAARRSSP